MTDKLENGSTELGRLSVRAILLLDKALRLFGASLESEEERLRVSGLRLRLFN